MGLNIVQNVRSFGMTGFGKLKPTAPLCSA